MKKLTAFHIIEYIPQNDAPFIIFKRNRVATENLTINLPLYKKRKEAFIERIKKIIDYTQTKECRSILVNHYFGDHDIKACGICDNCRRAKALHLTTEEFEKIKNSICVALKTKSIGSLELLGTLQGINKEKAWSVLNFLQAEQKVFINEKGELSLS